MPVQRCQKGGRSGYAWGPRGTCFTGPGAQAKAAKVGRAIAARRRRQDQANRIILPPEAIEADYRRLMDRRLRALQKRLVAAVKREMKKLPGIAERARGDGADEDAAALVQAIRVSERQWQVDVPFADAGSDVLDIATQVDTFTTRRTAKAVERVPAISTEAILANAGEVTPALERWARVNVELIGNMEAAHYDDVAKLIAEAVESGQSTRDVTKVLTDRFGVSRRRAKFIARDQIGTLNAQVTQKRQEDLGITQFIWSTVGDDRVREEHVVLDGRTFDWATGAGDQGLPGTTPNCRCVSLPVIPE
jgi:SPP1 gp7 family putative phage head morphogenesis protein